MVLQRYVIVVGTAFGGAWTLIVGGLAVAGDRGARARCGGWRASGFCIRLTPAARPALGADRLDRPRAGRYGRAAHAS